MSEERFKEIIRRNRQRGIESVLVEKPLPTKKLKFPNIFPRKRNREIPYILNGKRRFLRFQLERKKVPLLNHRKPYEEEIREIINSREERNSIQPLLEAIKKKTRFSEEQARIAISLVQHIPYGRENKKDKTPAQVLYTNKGVCGEKSSLLCSILKELGYGTALFLYDNFDNYENTRKKGESFLHINTGIKSQKKHQYEGSGYAVIEATMPSIISDYYWGERKDKKSRTWERRLPKDFKLAKISDGKELDASREYIDAQEIIRMRILEENGVRLSGKDIKEYGRLIKQYGL